MRQLGITSVSHHVSLQHKLTASLPPKKKNVRGGRVERRRERKLRRVLRNDCCRRFCFAPSAASRSETKESALANSFRSPFLRYPFPETVACVVRPSTVAVRPKQGGRVLPSTSSYLQPQRHYGANVSATFITGAVTSLTFLRKPLLLRGTGGKSECKVGGNQSTTTVHECAPLTEAFP